ncbi:hypothetical protein [Nostoc sp. WHI]|uniref:hypothetical protein n=1 Tax=Nostoc sp. WHI TaxID=2650611 RepID=UPI0018C4EE7A|nr:hypothetical protein [Nostoc sp. WHI]
MNSGLTYEQETFVQDSIPVRLEKLATNLARINQLFSESTHEEGAMRFCEVGQKKCDR